jgi:hypothetical protein
LWISSWASHHALLKFRGMSLWHIRPQTGLRVILALVTTVLPLVAIVVGGMDLLTWMRVHWSSQYYVDHGYLGDAGWWLLLGMIGVLPTGWVFLQPQARLRWLWLPALVSLSMIAYPKFAAPLPYERARGHVHNQLSQVYDELRHAAEQGQPWHCVSGPTTAVSPYSRAGERLSYQRVCVTADRPMGSLLASSAPGTIYTATSPGEQVVWLMATVLPYNVGDSVSWLQERTGQPVLLTFSLLTSP